MIRGRIGASANVTLGGSGAGSGGSQCELAVGLAVGAHSGERSQWGWQWGPAVGTHTGTNQPHRAWATTSPRPNRVPNFGGAFLDSAQGDITPHWVRLLAEVVI